jgi:hypothetical protein
VLVIEGISYDFADAAPVLEPAPLPLTATALANLPRRRGTRLTSA